MLIFTIYGCMFTLNNLYILQYATIKCLHTGLMLNMISVILIRYVVNNAMDI
jgi:hypothetical protein